jgi:tripartite-type tricarboxylate transporter receptor subunit TctC
MSRTARSTGIVLIAACVLAGVAAGALAQGAAGYPTRPIRIIVIFAPGGGLDIVGRLVADPLSARIGQPVIVENRPGAGGNIATGYAARATPDGHTLLLTTNSYNINAFLYRTPGYDARKDFAPVVELTAAASIIIAHPGAPFRSLKDLVSAARAQPGKIPYASGGNGAPTHIAAEMFKKAANIDLSHIPYKGGGPANQDVIAGQVPLAMAALPPVMPHLLAGRLRGLAVTSERRWPALPDVPTIVESGYPGYSHITWIGIVAPAATPRTVIARLNREIAEVLSSRDLRERINQLGAEPVGRGTAEFAAMLKAEYEAMGKLVPQLGIKVD